MSICIACHGQPEGGGASVCLPAYLSKDRKWLTYSGGVNFLPVINLALPVAACQPAMNISWAQFNSDQHVHSERHLVIRF